MAAPVPGLPAAAPIAAPAAAPTAVPTAALATVLLVAAAPGVVPPTCWCAQARQPASSAWNCSNGFPVPGSTITLGPEGIVAHAAKRTVTGSNPIHFQDIASRYWPDIG